MDAWDELPARARDLLGLDIGKEANDRLREFGRLVLHWSARMNLVSVSSERELAERHVLDSLAPAALLDESDRVVDLGSGAGLPGIPLAILAPRRRIVLVEARRRRASFLRAARRELDLDVVEVAEGRAEELAAAWSRPCDVVTARGVDVAVVASFAAAVLPPHGRIIRMRTARQSDEAVPGFRPTRSLAYVLPGGQKHEAVALERARFT